MSSEETPELQIGEVEGWRVFDASNGYLEAIAGEYKWVPGPNQAVCTSHRTTQKVLRNGPNGVEQVEISTHGLIPDPTCHCGFWFYKTVSGLLVHFPTISRMQLKGGYRNSGYGDFHGSVQSLGQIMAQVKGWGRVVEGEDGYRAEYAQVTAIVDDGRQGLEEYANRYDVPLIVLEELKDGTRKTVRGLVKKLGPKVAARSAGRTRTSYTTSTTRWRPSQVIIEEAVDTDQIATSTELKVWPDGHARRQEPGKLYELLSQAQEQGREVIVQADLKVSRYGEDWFINKVELGAVPEEDDGLPELP